MSLSVATVLNGTETPNPSMCQPVVTAAAPVANPIEANARSVEAKVRALLDKCHLSPDVEDEVAARMEAAREALGAGDLNRLSKVYDQILFSVQRNMGTAIPLTTARDLFNVIVREFQIDVKDPARLYQDTVEFGTRYVAVGKAGGGIPEIARLPYVGDMEARLRRTIESIKDCGLPEDVEQILFNQIDQLVTAVQQEDDLAVFEALSDVSAFVVGTTGVLVTQSQANEILGNVGVTVAACILDWIYLILVAALILTLLGIALTPSTRAEGQALVDIGNFVDNSGKNTSRKTVQSATQMAIKDNDLDDDELQSLADNLQEAIEGLKDSKNQKAKLSDPKTRIRLLGWARETVLKELEKRKD